MLRPMTQVIEIPVWLALIGAVAALVAVVDRLVAPSFRWLMRRQLQRAVDRLNETLRLRIQPFKLLSRSFLIKRLTHDPEVMRAVEAHVADTGMPRDIAHRQVLRYAKETAPAFSAGMYFGVGARFCRWVAQALYQVRLGGMDRRALAKVDPEAAVVFVINHRSNVDYLLVTHLAAGAATISYAVGEWARFWPLAPVIRSMGAFFIRRGERGPLYRAVLRRYVQMAVEGGVTQAVFLEGGLSRDGGPGRPKLGLLAYLLEGAGARDVIFAPVGINYDRVLEDRVVMTGTGPAGAAHFELRPLAIIRAVGGWLALRLVGRAEPLGAASVGLGKPLSARAWLAKDGDVTALGDELMRRIIAATPVLPVPLVAAAVEGAAPVPRAALAARAAELAAELSAAGRYLSLPETGLDAAIEEAIEALIRRGLLREAAAGLAPAPEEAALVAYYARSVTGGTEAN